MKLEAGSAVAAMGMAFGLEIQHSFWDNIFAAGWTGLGSDRSGRR